MGQHRERGLVVDFLNEMFFAVIVEDICQAINSFHCCGGGTWMGTVSINGPIKGKAPKGRHIACCLHTLECIVLSWLVGHSSIHSSVRLSINISILIVKSLIASLVIKSNAYTQPCTEERLNGSMAPATHRCARQAYVHYFLIDNEGKLK